MTPRLLTTAALALLAAACDPGRGRVPEHPSTPNAPPNASAPAPAPRDLKADADLDGIANELDACPDTPGEPDASRYRNGCLHACHTCGQPPIFLPMRFDDGSVAPRADDHDQLDDMAKTLAKRPEITKLLVSGHAASGEPDALATSVARAERVVAELVKRGVDPTRLEAKGFGAERPISENLTAQGRTNNRRVQFEVLEPPR